jgi:hypothetical protein
MIQKNGDCHHFLNENRACLPAVALAKAEGLA